MGMIVDVEDVDGWGFVALLYFFFSAVILHGCLPREYVSVDYFGVVDDHLTSPHQAAISISTPNANRLHRDMETN